MEATRAKSWNWARDELILALDLYFKRSLLPTSSTDPDVIELSETLRHLPLFPADERPANFRNPTGVYFKLLNFHYIGTNGAAGYSNFGARDQDVWTEFAADRPRLHAVADAIRRGAGDPVLATMDDSPEDVEAPEGRVLMRMHRIKERSPALVRERKRRALKAHGVLKCETCGFDFKAVYGEIGDGFIECHHTVPLSTLSSDQKTNIGDLALVCANCHRMLHRGGQLLTITALQEQLSETKEKTIGTCV